MQAAGVTADSGLVLDATSLLLTSPVFGTATKPSR